MEWGNVALVTRLVDFDPGFFNAWTQLVRGGLRPDDVVLPGTVRMAAHHAANAIIYMFLNSEQTAHCDTLVTVDYDQVFPPDALERLRTDEAGKSYDMLGALYLCRTDRRPLVLQLAPGQTLDDFEPGYAVALDWQRGDIVDVDLCPLGFTLTRRQLLLDVGGTDGPWFGYRGPETTEDVDFCCRARKLGGRLGIHTGVPIGHVIRGVSVPYEDMRAAYGPPV